MKIDKNDLPIDEIIAANFMPFTYGYKEKLLGYLYIKGDTIICENDNEMLENCSHYIPINKFDPIF